MRNSVLIGLLLATTVVGQASAQDVVMRRPLPFSKALTQTDCAPGQPDCTPTPTPTTTPGDDGFTPYTPTPDPTKPTQPPGDGSYLYWSVGPWQGSATCGQQSTLTRSVTCTQGVFNYTPSFSYQEYDVDPSACVNDPDPDGAGPAPSASYVGTKGGCSFTPVFGDPGPWKLDPGSTEDVTCSPNAHRDYPATCQASDGSTVDMKFCFENPSADGERNYDTVKSDYGNYAGCSYAWNTTSQNIGCHAAGIPQSADYLTVANSPKGPVFYSSYTSSCTRSDGTVLYDGDTDQCTNSIGSAPSGILPSGTCHKVFAPADRNSFPGSGITDPSFGYCNEGDGKVVVKTLVRQNRDLGVDERAVEAQCVAGGATCLSTRVTLSSNYTEPYNTLQMVCTTGPGHRAANDKSYSDACGESTDGSCPLFYANSLSAITYEKDQ